MTVAAGYTKNGDPATLQVPADVASDLENFILGIPATAAVFPLPDKGSEMLREDSALVGILYRDESGLVFDFHALWSQCVTLADQAGVSPQVVQKLMRHSTLGLTGRYIRPRMFDMESVASVLPSFRPDHPRSETVAATGTDSGRIKKPLAQICPSDGTVRSEGWWRGKGSRPAVDGS